MQEGSEIVVRSPPLRRLLADWHERRRGRLMPSRRDFDPLDLRYVLGKLALVDVLREPLRFRFRLIGTDLVAHAGRDLTGTMLDRYPDPEYREMIRRRYVEVVEARCPICSIQSRLVVDNKIRRYEALLLPLAEDGERVDMLLTGLIYL